MARPARVFILALKPWLRLRFSTLGWKVLFIIYICQQKILQFYHTWTASVCLLNMSFFANIALIKPNLEKDVDNEGSE
jgi:hypothetical protein